MCESCEMFAVVVFCVIFCSSLFVYTSVSLSCIFFFKQMTAYDMRISDWSSDVCSSDLGRLALRSKKADPLALRVERRARRRDPGLGTRAASVALVDLRLADRAAVNQRLTPVAGLARQHQVDRKSVV